MLDVDDAPPLSLNPLHEGGLQVVRGFFKGRAQEAMARRGQEVIEGVDAGTITRSGQFALGFAQSWFEEVFADPALLDLVAQQLGPDLCILTWRILMKDHHFQGPINVHQDWPYFGGDTRKLNVFVPLTAVSEENGGLVFYERSHLYGPLERGDIDVASFAADLTTTCPTLEVGDVLLADFLTWHYSAPSQVPKHRIMFQLVFQPADDPSSAHLLRGKRHNPFLAPDRYSCLSEPLSLMNVPAARACLAAGDVDRAERFARGILASDPDHIGAVLLLSDILKVKGQDGAAESQIAVAQAALDRTSTALFERVPIPRHVPAAPVQQAAAPDAEMRQAIESLEQELAQIKRSRSWRWTKVLRR